MSLTSIKYDYNVAKVIDTPWNTIINGLNYTKTNLAPLGLKNTYAKNYDCGLILKEIAGNSFKNNSPIEDFSFSNSVIDIQDSNKCWLLSTSYNSSNNNALCLCSTKNIDSNGYEYSNINEAYLNGMQGCGQIWYQDNTTMYVYWTTATYNTYEATTYLCRFKKDGNKLTLVQSYNNTQGICSLIDIKDGVIYYLEQYCKAEKSGTSTTTYQNINKIEASSGLKSTLYSITNGNMSSYTTYPTKVINETFYWYCCSLQKWYRFQFTDNRKNVVKTELTVDFDTYDTGDGGTYYIGYDKRFSFLYEDNDTYYIVAITLKSYSYKWGNDNTTKSGIQVYRIENDNLIRIQEIPLTCFSLIPKNDNKTFFIGTLSGICVYQYDEIQHKIVEQPSILTTVKQFGFDMDERLWILTADDDIIRYTYNQPLTVDYIFEKNRYLIGADIIESWVKLKILNYMGNSINSKIKIKAIGNFTFENEQKEIELNISKDDYITIPIYIYGSGKYEIEI